MGVCIALRGVKITSAAASVGELRVELSSSGKTHQDELEERGLVHLHEVRVERLLLLLGRRLLLVRLGGVHVVLAVLDHLGQDLAAHVGQRDGVVQPRVCHVHVRATYSQWRVSCLGVGQPQATTLGHPHESSDTGGELWGRLAPSIMFLIMSDLL